MKLLKPFGKKEKPVDFGIELKIEEQESTPGFEILIELRKGTVL